MATVINMNKVTHQSYVLIVQSENCIAVTSSKHLALCWLKKIFFFFLLLLFLIWSKDRPPIHTHTLNSNVKLPAVSRPFYFAFLCATCWLRTVSIFLHLFTEQSVSWLPDLDTSTVNIHKYERSKVRGELIGSTVTDFCHQAE